MIQKYIFNVGELNCSKRLDLYVLEQNILNSRNSVQNLIKKKQVFVNGKEEKASYKVIMNDEITVYLSDESSVIIKGENIKLNIVYEDENVVVVNKPKNMLTHPTNKESSQTLVNALLYKYGYEGLSNINGILRPGIVHRLDRNTSGLLLIAKNNKSHEFLANQIKEKTAVRKYLAIVHGNFEINEGIIDMPIARSIKNPEKMEVRDDGKPSITIYKVLENYKGFSYVELTLLTGRTHQIRVHMSKIGHPIVNDSLYNKEKFKVKTTEQVLQAYKLSFTTLKSNDIISLEIDLDNDIKKVLKYLSNQ